MAGFFGSPPSIYKKLQWDGKASSIADECIISQFAALENAGFYWDAYKIKLCNRSDKRQIVYQTPWIHQRNGATKRCGFDHQICFNFFGIIPPRCLECWKVVVNPRTFIELVALRDLQKELDVNSKCGIEMRDYTSKLYGGYFYTDSFDEGRERYKQIRETVNDCISPDVPVILKRGCTEFEMLKGPSHHWHMTPKEEETLLILENYVEIQNSNTPQCAECKNYVFLKWMMWAHASGDMTYTDWNGGKVLFPTVVTYHEDNREKIKQELAIAKAHSISGMDGKDAKKMLTSVFNAATEHNLDPNAVFNMGGNTQNVLQFKPLTEVPEEAKGDLDELT